MEMVGSGSPNGGSTPPPPPQQEQANKYGLTKPISLAGPTDADLHRNLELEKVINYRLIHLIINYLILSPYKIKFQFFFFFFSSWLMPSFTRAMKKLQPDEKFFAASIRSPTSSILLFSTCL